MLAIETLTLLFTDIEGSTSLIRQLGADDYARALADHHGFIRAAIEAHDGNERGTQGDSFFATFTSPTACVTAAVEIQRILSQHEWPKGARVRVRMGIHTGEVTSASTGLVGYEVHRASRIGAVAHGGQILLSSATTMLVQDTLPPEITLRGLGAHRLKDLGLPEALFQVVASGLIDGFPTIRSLDHPQLLNNLPVSLSPFIGRTEELKEVVALLSGSRLVTLTGAGGSGKTRLALQAAAEVLDRSGDGVWLVELASLSDPEQISTTMIDALGVQRDDDRDDPDLLLNALSLQKCLIVIDNCEHLIRPVAMLVDLIGRSCPKVSILATSREPLGVDGEDVYRVPSLSLPSPDVSDVEGLRGYDSVDLFIARARLLDKHFTVTNSNAPTVGSVCRRLDGIPLAIELAAARLSSMSLLHLHDRLDQRFRLLTGGSRHALPRQQTLDATIAWSYDLLTEPEREVLRRLTVFVDGFTLESAEAVCGSGMPEDPAASDLLGSLVNKSLVVAERGDLTLRYRLLESIRQYGAELLLQVDGEAGARQTRRMHADHFLAQCVELQLDLIGPGQAEALDHVAVEWGNVLAALAFFEDAGRSSDVLRLVIALGRYCMNRLKGEPFVAMHRVVGQVESSLLRATAIVTLAFGIRLERQGGLHAPVTLDLCDEAISVARDDGNRGLEVLAWIARRGLEWTSSDFNSGADSARTAFAVACDLGDPWLLGLANYYVALTLPKGQRQAVLEQAATLLRQVGDLTSLHWVLQMFAIEAMLDSDDELAYLRATATEQVELAQLLGILSSSAVETLAEVECLSGNDDRASELARAVIYSSRRSGFPTEAYIMVMLVLAVGAARRGQHRRAGILLGRVAETERAAFDLEGDTWTPAERRVQADALESVKVAISEDECARMMTIGGAMGREELFDFLLEDNEVDAMVGSK